MQLFTPAAIALSNGASSSTTNADLPPSSRQTFLMPSPASEATRRPACKRSGEADHVDVGVADNGFADHASRAADDVEDTGGKSDLVCRIGEHQRAQRRELRGLEHDGAAGRQRGRDFGDDLVQRIVPRRDAADDADGSLTTSELPISSSNVCSRRNLPLSAIIEIGNSACTCVAKPIAVPTSCVIASATCGTRAFIAADSFSSHCARSSAWCGSSRVEGLARGRARRDRRPRQSHAARDRWLLRWQRRRRRSASVVAGFCQSPP